MASKYYGVRLETSKTNAWWKSEIIINKKKYYFGSYRTEEEAAFAFNEGFKYVSNGKFNINNNVSFKSEEIKKKVRLLMVNRHI